MKFLQQGLGILNRSLYNNKSFTRLFCSEVNSNNGDIQLKYLTGENKGIAIIGLNRPNAMNAFSRSLVKYLYNAVEILKFEKSVRVVIIRSLVPGVFCAGADLKERAKMTPEEVPKFVSSLRNILVNIEQLPMPVIGAVDGVALGGGLELALACDFIVASKSAKLGLVETKLAIIPGAGGTQRLPRILSPAKAKELIYTSRILSGEEAEKFGLCNYSVEQNNEKDAAFQKSLKIAQEILPNGPVGVKMAKKAINSGIQVDLNTGYAIEEACYAQVISTKDRLEGLKAFAEKRKPQYTGE